MYYASSAPQPIWTEKLPQWYIAVCYLAIVSVASMSVAVILQCRPFRDEAGQWCSFLFSARDESMHLVAWTGFSILLFCVHVPLFAVFPDGDETQWAWAHDNESRCDVLGFTFSTVTTCGGAWVCVMCVHMWCKGIGVQNSPRMRDYHAAVWLVSLSSGLAWCLLSDASTGSVFIEGYGKARCQVIPRGDRSDLRSLALAVPEVLMISFTGIIFVLRFKHRQRFATTRALQKPHYELWYFVVMVIVFIPYITM